MRQGLVFGKFYPFHKGHQALIDFALEYCDQLIVLVCATASETIPGKTRASWLLHTYSDDASVRVDVLHYDEDKLPNTSVSSRTVSRQWAAVFSNRYPSLDVVFTSEPYGDYLAEFMGISHIPFDPNRNLNLISGTEIRESPLRHWDYLPAAVKPYFLKKVVVLGTESTGKTTLCQRLAAHYKTGYVEEAGRLVVQDSKRTSSSDLERIVAAHAAMIDERVPGAQKLLFIDTDMHITMSYSNFLFNKPLEIPEWVREANRADLYLFLDKDAPYIQDGGRLERKERDELHHSHLGLLDSHNIEYNIINGNWHERFEKAKALIDNLLFCSVRINDDIP